jgi:hypothetical protein
MFRFSKFKLSNGLTATMYFLDDPRMTSVAAACLNPYPLTNDPRQKIFKRERGDHLIFKVKLEKRFMYLVLYGSADLNQWRDSDGESLLRRLFPRHSIFTRPSNVVNINMLTDVCFVYVYNNVAYRSLDDETLLLKESLIAGRQPEIYALIGGQKSHQPH